MTTNEIAEALAEASAAVEVPTVDEVAFRARVRAERRTRAIGRGILGVAAAAVVVTGVVAASGLVGQNDNRVVAGPPLVAEGTVSESVFFTMDGRLTAVDPRGVAHDLGLRSEGVIGWTSERVYALDDDSHVEVRRVDYDDEGARVPSFSEEPSPVRGAVQGVALSGDGRYLAWLDLEDTIHRYDLKAEREDLTFGVGRDARLESVAASGVLVYENARLTVRDGQRTIPILVDDPHYGVATDLALGHVLVQDREGQSWLYDVRDGSAAETARIPGRGVLGPYAERVATIIEEPSDQWRLEVWDGGSMLPVSGLPGTPLVARWADETTLLVTSSDEGDQGLYSCDIDLECGLLVEGDIQLHR